MPGLMTQWGAVRYHDDGDSFIGGGLALMRADYTLMLAVRRYDQLEAAWDYVLERRDELVVVDRNGRRRRIDSRRNHGD